MRLVVSAMMGTLGSVGFWAVIVVLPAVQEEFGVDRADASFPYTLTMIGFALGNYVIGRYVDRLGIFLPLVATSLALGIGFLGAALSGSIWVFATIQGILIGIGTAATFGPLIADVSHWFRRRRGIAVALVSCGNYFGGMLWPLVIKVGLELDDWRSCYFVISAVCILVMTPAALLLRRPAPVGVRAPGATPPPAPLAIGLSQRTLVALLAVAGVSCCVAMSMPQVHIIAYSSDLGYGIGPGAEMLSLMLAGGAVSRVISGFLADQIGGVRTLLLSSILQCIALFLYLPFDGLASLYAVSLIFGLSQGGIVPSYAIIVREYMPARVAGQRVGILIMASVLGMGLGGWLSGWIFDFTSSYQAAFLNGIAWNLVNIGIVLLILMRTWGRMRPAAA